MATSENHKTEEIREFGGRKYRVVKTPCHCPCHSSKGKVKHVRACCEDGYKSHLVPINEDNETQTYGEY